MSLTLYCGLPGSGKSYSVVEYVVIPALQKGRHVVTNIPLEVDLLIQVYGGKITQLPLDALSDPNLPDTIPHGAVCVVDEVWNRWPAGLKVSNASEKDLHWLKEHRHRVDADGNSMQVILVTQAQSDLAAWVRKLISHTFHMRKLEEIGQRNRFRITVYQGCPTGDNVPKRFVVREAFGTYKPDIYQFYRSATQSQTIDVGDEVALDKRTNVFTSPSFIFTCVFVVAAVIGGISLGSSYISNKQGGSSSVDSVQRVQAPPLKELPADFATLPPVSPVRQQQQVVQLPPQSVPDKLPVSPSWRVSGYIRAASADDEPYQLTDGSENWPSVKGFFKDPPPQSKTTWMQDQVILSGIAGTRVVPISACQRYDGTHHYFCDIDGERVTPWSGQQAFSKTVGQQPTSVARDAVSSPASL